MFIGWLMPTILYLVTTIRGETFCPTVSSALDNRTNKSKLRIVQYNIEWFFVDYYAASDCPGNGCSWKTQNDALKHVDVVSNIIRELQPDVLNLCEIEGCDELTLLQNASQNSLYKPYMIKGKDTSTGQNVGLLTLIDPIMNLYRTDERVKFPIQGSTCGYNGEPGDSGVSKHYITEYKINDLHIAMIGAHLVAFPTDSARCAQREAQAQILQNVIATYISKKIEVVVMGDFNDFDGEVLDSNNNKPLSSVLDIIKGKKGAKSSYELISAAEKIDKSQRYTDWWDQNKNCNSTSTEFSMIDHILVTPALYDKISNAFVYHGYDEYCGTYNSDHYPVVVDFTI
jgi:exonuclease III